MLLAFIYFIQIRPFCFHIFSIQKKHTHKTLLRSKKLKTSSLMCLHFQLQNVNANINSKSPVAFAESIVKKI